MSKKRENEKSWKNGTEAKLTRNLGLNGQSSLA